MQYTIFHNPRCRKSRETLALMQEKGIEPDIFLYLDTNISTEMLGNITDNLNIQPTDLLRKSEKVFKENFKGKEFSREEWLQIMVDNPKLIERPIVIREDGRAVLGRPPENVLEII